MQSDPSPADEARAALERAHGGEECPGDEECMLCRGELARAYQEQARAKETLKAQVVSVLSCKRRAYRERDNAVDVAAKIEAQNRALAQERDALRRECEQYAATIKDVFSHDWMDRAAKAEAERDEARAEAKELELIADLQANAVQRATAEWHAAGGDKLTRPDLKDLILWLLEERADLARVTQERDALRERLVDEHEGSAARADADAWERKCARAESDRDEYRDALKDLYEDVTDHTSMSMRTHEENRAAIERTVEVKRRARAALRAAEQTTPAGPAGGDNRED